MELQTGLDEYMHKHREHINSGIEDVRALCAEIRVSESIQADLTKYASTKMDDLIAVYRKAVEILVDTAQKDLVFLQESFSSELCMFEFENTRIVDTLIDLNRIISKSDEEVLSRLILNHNSTVSKNTVNNHSLHATTLQNEIKQVRKDQELEISAPKKELMRSKETENESVEIHENRKRLFRKYSNDIRKLAQDESVKELQAMNSQLQLEKKNLIEGIQNIRNSIKIQNRQNADKFVRLAHNYDTCKTNLDNDLAIIEEIQRMDALARKYEQKHVPHTTLDKRIAQGAMELIHTECKAQELNNTNQKLRMQIQNIANSQIFTDKTLEKLLGKQIVHNTTYGPIRVSILLEHSLEPHKLFAFCQRQVLTHLTIPPIQSNHSANEDGVQLPFSFFLSAHRNTLHVPKFD